MYVEKQFSGNRFTKQYVVDGSVKNDENDSKNNVNSTKDKERHDHCEPCPESWYKRHADLLNKTKTYINLVQVCQKTFAQFYRI